MKDQFSFPIIYENKICLSYNMYSQGSETMWHCLNVGGCYSIILYISTIAPRPNEAAEMPKMRGGIYMCG